MRLNSVFYTIGPEAQQLMEVIPVKGTYMYQELLDNVKSALKKKEAQAGIEDMTQVSAKDILNEAETQALNIWETAKRYHEDMAYLCKETFGEKYTTNVLTDIDR